MSKTRHRIRCLWVSALALGIATGCAQSSPTGDSGTAAEPVAASEPGTPGALGPETSGGSSCDGSNLPRTLVETPPAVRQVLRSARGPLPLVTYGPLAEAAEGDQNYRQQIRFAIPETATRNLPPGERGVHFQIFDADTGWRIRADRSRPWDDEPNGGWNTVTRFRLLGADGTVLVEHLSVAGGDDPSDQKWLSWGPISLDCAATSEGLHELTLDVEGLEGNDGNAYLVGLSASGEPGDLPDGLRVTAEEVTVRLVDSDQSAAELLFDIPAGSREITIRSFDLARGGLELETAVRARPVAPSGQGVAVDEIKSLFDEEAGAPAALVFAGGVRDNPNDVTFALWADGEPLRIRIPGSRRSPAPRNRPPVARVWSSVQADCRTVDFDGSSSSDPDGDEIGFDWDFGDGNHAEGPRVSHTYAEPGAYAGRLLVRDDSGEVLHAGRRAFERRIWAPPEAQAGTDLVGAPGIPLELDGSGSSDPDGGELRYRWDFGDGTRGRGGKLSHRWRRPGTYEVTLAVEDDGDPPCNLDSDSLVVLINDPPVAEAGPARIDVAPGQTIEFDGSASYDPEGEQLRHRWEFGDGRTADGAEVSHSYEQPGTYRARLAVTDPSGAPNAEQTDGVEVFVNAPPRPRALAALPSCSVGASMPCFESCDLAVELDGSDSTDADGDRLSFAWSFGDGSEAATRRPGHTYAGDGEYTVRLTVDDGRGLANSRQTSELVMRVRRPPRAAAGPAVRSVEAGQPLLLSGAGSVTWGDVGLRYQWDFDFQAASESMATTGGGSADPTAVHRYQEPGDYRVRLTVTDDSGFQHCRTDSTEVRIRVE